MNVISKQKGVSFNWVYLMNVIFVYLVDYNFEIIIIGEIFIFYGKNLVIFANLIFYLL
jgi:hypothetical protein